MVKAIESGNLDNILHVADFLKYISVIKALKQFKYVKVSNKQLESLETVIIKGGKL
jgi:hypothetical protein